MMIEPIYAALTVVAMPAARCSDKHTVGAEAFMRAGEARRIQAVQELDKIHLIIFLEHSWVRDCNNHAE